MIRLLKCESQRSYQYRCQCDLLKRFTLANYRFFISRQLHFGQQLLTVDPERQQKLSAAETEKKLQLLKRNLSEGQKKGASEGSSNTNKKSEVPRSTRLLFYSLPVVFLISCAVVSWFVDGRSKSRSKDSSGKAIITFTYSQLPLNALSRLIGRLCSAELPLFARQTIYGAYIRATGVNIDEAADTELRNYASLSALFQRRLKPELRAIDNEAVVVSPCDGFVFHCGVVKSNQLYQIKNERFNLAEFLGSSSWQQLSSESGHQVSSPLHIASHSHSTRDNSKQQNSASSFEELVTSVKTDPRNELYYANLYLAPGNYHRFHSPADWEVHFRKYFAGALLSVRQEVAANFENLYCVNERVVYVGTWKHGFFSMSPVGATGVGNIQMLFDRELITNKRRQAEENSERKFEPGVSLTKGDEFGAFNFGSTIVLVFEAPSGLEFTCDPASESATPIRYGQALLKKPTTFG